MQTKKRKYTKRVKATDEKPSKELKKIEPVPEVKNVPAVVQETSKEIQINPHINVDPQALIKIAIEKGVPIDVLERLLAMRERLQGEQAEIEFREALSNFQSECPVIVKRKEVYDKYGKLRYRYAPLDDILKQIKPYLKENGLSYDIDTQITNNPSGITTIVKICHKLGHSKTTTFNVPVDKDSYMSEPQKWASAQTFSKRYAFCNGFGILTGDEDDDTVILLKNDSPPQQAKISNSSPPPIEVPTMEEMEKVYSGIKEKLLSTDNMKALTTIIESYKPAIFQLIPEMQNDLRSIYKNKMNNFKSKVVESAGELL